MKHRTPKVPKEGFGELPGSPRDGPGRPKGGLELHFCLGKTMVFKKLTKMTLQTRKNMKNNRWTHVVDKRFQKSAPMCPYSKPRRGRNVGFAKGILRFQENRDFDEMCFFSEKLLP